MNHLPSPGSTRYFLSARAIQRCPRFPHKRFRMNLQVQQLDDGIILLVLEGELTRQTVHIPADWLLTNCQPDTRYIVDLNNVSYVSSMGLRMLLMFFRRLEAISSRLIFFSLNEGIWDTMSITGFLDFLELYESQEEAIAAARVSPENRF